MSGDRAPLTGSIATARLVDEVPAPDMSDRPVLIAIPFYKNPHLVQRLVSSLMDCASEITAMGAEIVLYNDSPDHAPLSEALAAILPAAARAFPCRVETNTHNLGFVGTMNAAFGEAAARRFDVLLLNSDTVVFPGALSEMKRVSTLDPMIGFVNPRSNNATLASLPHQASYRTADPQTAYAGYKAVASYLPEMSYVPTAIGFCMLIRWEIISEFGFFDEIYGGGYNEENDLVMRASRCGYRAVLANRAYVWHEGEQSFSTSGVPKSKREERNRAILLGRYPEFASLTYAYFHSPQYVAELLLGKLIPDKNGKIDLALDFSTFGPSHNGTYEVGKHLLREAAKSWRDRFNVHVICSREVYDFHGYAEYGIARHGAHDDQQYAAMFRMGQPYDWNSIERMVVKGTSIGIFMLDTISVDCGQIYSTRLFNIWQFALSQFDVVGTNSIETTGQFERRFSYGPSVVRTRSMHSLDISDYALTNSGSASQSPVAEAGYLFVVGNHYPHKYVAPTTNALSVAYPARTIVALGADKASSPPPDEGRYAPSGFLDMPNLKSVPAGELSDDVIANLYSQAGAVIFPSHYEGFGIPILNALAAKRPVFIRRLPVFEELWEEIGRNPNIHFYENTTDLIERLKTVPVWVEPTRQPRPDNGAARVARELRAGIEEALSRVTYERIVERVRAVQFVSDIASERGMRAQPITNSGFAARMLSERIERIAEKLLNKPIVYRSARILFRIAKALSRTGD